MKKIISSAIRAIRQFDMIQTDDHIVVGLSGGKDSLTLLTALAHIQKYSEYKFRLSALSIDLGFENADFSQLKKYCNKLAVPLTIYNSDIKNVVFDIKKEKNPCSLCAKLRRGILCEQGKKMGANKIALGHHIDDLVETFFLSLIYEGRVSMFSPVTYMDRTDITTIRPLIYVNESQIKAQAKTLPVFFNPCPADKHTKREETKRLFKELSKFHPNARTNIISALTSYDRYNLWDKNSNPNKK